MPHFIGRSFPRVIIGLVEMCPMSWFLVGISAAQMSRIGPKTAFLGNGPKTTRPKGLISEYSLHTGGEFPWTCFGAPNVCSKSPIFGVLLKPAKSVIVSQLALPSQRYCVLSGHVSVAILLVVEIRSDTVRGSVHELRGWTPFLVSAKAWEDKP